MASVPNALVQEFLIESFESLSNINDELTTYEKNPGDKELLNSIFRKVHTLKGSSSFLGLKKLQEITHSAESILDLIREGVVKINSEMVDVFLECFDTCQELLRNIENSGAENNKDYGPLIGKLSTTLERSTNISEALHNPTSKISANLLDQDLQSMPKKVETKTIKEEIVSKPILEVKKEVIKDITVKPEAKMETSKNTTSASENSGSENSASKGGGITDSVVRVNVQLLDKIMNVVGELVLNRNQILQYANVVDSTDLNRLAQQLNIITTELQTDIMTTRMQPVGSVLAKFERIVRDLAKSQSKKIRLEIFGKDTELDKTLLEAIRDPLTHLIRNSVDHGVELPENRIAKGKPEEGRICIKSYHEGGQITIEISDDGNGIDPQRVLDKAIQKGIVTPEQGVKMTARQILNIIFMPGFSTAEQVTNISGRGVGMDVVKSNIEKIGGAVDVHSVLGSGTTFKLKIPLTLAIVPALVVQDLGETYAIPQINLVELVRLENDDNENKIEILHDSEFFRLRGNLIPIFRLGKSLGLKNDKHINTDTEGVNIVILRADGHIYGIIVESILDTEEIVVKPLSLKLKDLTYFAGATIMGDGIVALIIDTLGFFNKVDHGNDHGQKGEQFGAEETDEKYLTDKSEQQEVVLCSLGDGRHYAIPLILVNRLEEFKASQIEWSADQALIKYGDAPMPLVNLEKSLKLNGTSSLEGIKNDPNKTLHCVVVKLREQFFGFVVDSIRDTAVTDGEISSDSVDREGLLGTIFVTDKTITMLDIHAIIGMQKLGKNITRSHEGNNQGKILLVEDSPLYRKVVKDYLEDFGFEVFVANNGKLGLDFLNEVEAKEESKVNLIITDIEMPVMDGFEFTQAARFAEKSYSKLPIIALSTRVAPEDRQNGILAGFSEHLEKLNKDEVLRTVKTYLKK